MTGSATQQLHKGLVLDDRYEILEVIGSGGFGITYKAASLNLGRTVAVKEFFCQEYMTRDAVDYPAAKVYLADCQDRFESDRRKFLKEARIIRDFSEEPGIVHILDYFEANQTAYIVMEYLEGETLKDLLAREKRWPSKDIFKKMIPLITTLGKVHRGGVIHRDISPDNIMVLKDGSLRLIDFGAARNFAGSDTSYAMVLKDGYTPQEQYTGQEQGPWTDIYALSATLYQCITGRVPDNALQRILHDELKRPSELSIKIDSRLEHILMMGLALAGDKRYQTTDDMMKDIREVIPEDEGEKSLSKKAKIILSMTALILFTILLSAGWYVKAHWIEIKFRGKETIYVTLKRASINQTQYDSSLKILEERLKVFTNNNYVLEKTDSSHVKFYFLQSLCQDREIAYVLKNYLSRPMTFSVNLFGELESLNKNKDLNGDELSSIPNHPISLDPQDFLDVTLKKGQIKGIKNAQRIKLGLPKTGNYYYIHVTLNKDKALVLKSLYQYKESFQIRTNRETNPWQLTYLTAYLCDDGRSFDIIDLDQQKHFQQTLVHNLTSQKLHEAFVIEDYSWPVKWENPAESLGAGKNQVKRDLLKGETLTVKYNQYLTEGEETNQGKRFGTMIALKTRLDSIQIPYSFGLSKEKASTFIVCMETSRLLGVMPELLCSSSYFTLNSPLGSISNEIKDSDSLNLIRGKDGLPVFRLPVPTHGYDYEETTPEALFAFTKKYDDLGYRLRSGNNHNLAQGRLTGAETDGWLVLDQLFLTGDGPVSYSTAEALYPLLKMILQEDLLTTYNLEDYRFHDAKGTYLLEKTIADLPAYFDESQNQAIKQAAEKAGFEISINDSSISLSNYCKPAKSLQALEQFEEFFQQQKLFKSFYKNIYYYVSDSTDYHYIFRYSISSNAHYDNDAPGRNLKIQFDDAACRKALSDHVEKTHFYDAFTIKQD